MINPEMECTIPGRSKQAIVKIFAVLTRRIVAEMSGAWRLSMKHKRAQLLRKWGMFLHFKSVSVSLFIQAGGHA